MLKMYLPPAVGTGPRRGDPREDEVRDAGGPEVHVQVRAEERPLARLVNDLLAREVGQLVDKRVAGLAADQRTAAGSHGLADGRAAALLRRRAVAEVWEVRL